MRKGIRKGDPGAAITNEDAIAASNAKADLEIARFYEEAKKPRDRKRRYVAAKDPLAARIVGNRELRKLGGWIP